MKEFRNVVSNLNSLGAELDLHQLTYPEIRYAQKLVSEIKWHLSAYAEAIEKSASNEHSDTLLATCTSQYLEELLTAFTKLKSLVDELEVHQPTYPEILRALVLAQEAEKNLDIFCDAVELFEAIYVQRGLR